MFQYVKVLYQLLNVVKWNKKSDNMEAMLIAREEIKIIISYVDYSKTCRVIRIFTNWNQTSGKEDITFPLSSIQREFNGEKYI